MGRRRIVLGCRIVSPPSLSPIFPSSHFLDLDLLLNFGCLFGVVVMWLDPDGFRAVSFLSLVFPGSGRYVFFGSC